jgi:hypothetical protein
MASKMNKQINSNRNPELNFRLIHIENHSTDLMSTHINVAVNIAIELQIIVIKATPGTNSENDA